VFVSDAAGVHRLESPRADEIIRLLGASVAIV
jgi:hypothetical protein